jgi:hypothetical protein
MYNEHQANKQTNIIAHVLPSVCCNRENNSYASEVMTIMMIVNIAMETFSIIISSIFDHTDCQKFQGVKNTFVL